MKITDLKIDGFGVWRDLALRGLSPELTVLYGPNEAGKTTLMQFLRSVLYGVSPPRRERYLPPLLGGRPGGWLKVLDDNGPLTISRYADRGPSDIGKVAVTMADGAEQGDRLLREALENVDEATFNNIFAVGLREVQELGTLSDTAAAQWLYRLTSGLDRISLYDVIHMLAGTRQRLLGPADQPSEIRALTARRDQLRGELDELVAKGRRWCQAAVKLRELGDEVERRQSDAKELAAQARRLEIAVEIKPLWSKRAAIDGQLEQFRHLQPLEEGTLDALANLNKRVEEHERQRDILRGQRHQLRDEAKRLGINEILVRNGHRLEALVEQQEWLQSLDRRRGELADEVAQLEARLASENERLSRQWTGAGKLPPRITAEMIEQLAPQARGLEATDQLVDSAKRELEQHRVGEHQFRTQIESATTGGEKLGLPGDLEAAGDLVAGLRRRQQVEQRLEAARHQADDLQQQGCEMVDQQLVPMGQFLWLLATFVLGTIAVGVVWIAPPEWLGSYGHFAGWIAAAGVGLAIVSGLFKFMREGTAAGRFDACHRQLDLVLSQIDEAERERKRLDRELPLMEGSAALRLEHAERHLAELERVLPIEGQRHEAAREIAAAERRLALAEEKCAAARKNWQAKLRALGLPDDVSPANLATMAGQCERLAELETRIENRRDDLGRREREFEAVSQRIFDLADESGVPGAGSNRAPDQAASSMPAQTRQAKAQAPRPEPATVRPAMRALEQLDRLVAEFRQQQQRVTHRQELRARAKELKAEELRHARAAIGFSRRRTAIFQKCGVADEHELRQLAAKLNEAEELRKRRADVTRQIGAAIGKHGAEQDYAPLLALETIGRLESDWEALAAKRDALDRGLVELLQKRGALVEQQRAQAADRSLAVKQVELDCVDVQIKRATTAWRERAAVSLFLERIREDYEQHRQPETLQEASGYLRKLTSGRYTRIWTPLANDILFVDTPDGQALPVQVLSRGTREQLFVSLRLALVATFARRGIHLPLILDDVFVNFDAERTRIAADVLRDFAKQGHQLLVFTCHEHVWQIFQELKVDTRRLPSRFGDIEEGPATESPEPAATVVAKLSEPSSPQAILNPAPEMAEQPDAPYVEPLGIEIEEPAPTDAEEAEVDVEYAALAPSATPSPVEVEYWWPTTAGTR